MWSLCWMGKWNFVHRILVTWSRWPPCLYMVKTFESHLLRNGTADDLETWYAPLGTWALPSLYKWWPLVDLDLFYGKVKFGHKLLYGKKAELWIYVKLLQPMTFKVDICSHLNRLFFFTTKGQGHLLTFDLDASDSVFSSSPLKLLCWLKLNYMWSPCEWKFVHGIWVKWSRC